MNTETEVIKLLGSVDDSVEWKADSSLDSLDSLSISELSLEIASTFDISVDDKDYENIKTVPELVALVQSYIDKK